MCALQKAIRDRYLLTLCRALVHQGLIFRRLCLMTSNQRRTKSKSSKPYQTQSRKLTTKPNRVPLNAISLKRPLQSPSAPCNSKHPNQNKLSSCTRPPRRHPSQLQTTRTSAMPPRCVKQCLATTNRGKKSFSSRPSRTSTSCTMSSNNSSKRPRSSR